MGSNNTIKNKAIASAVWKFMERIIAQLVSLVVSIVLARILDPSDYSVVSLVTIFFAFANIIISGGLNTALIQKKDADDEDYSTVLYVSVLLSIIIYFILFFMAKPIAVAYRQPVLVPIIRVMSISLPIVAVKSIWCAKISSTLQFKKFFYATIGGTLVSAVVGIFMAIKGFGAWALVAQQMTNTTIDTIILVATTRITIVPKVNIEKLRGLFGYGWKVLVSSIIGKIYTEFNPLIIGLKYNSADLSFYTKGRSFPDYISTTTTNTLSAVLFPVLVNYQNDKKLLLQYTRRYIRLAAFICFPAMLGFMTIADTFVKVVLTEKWMSAVPYIRIFCISSMFDMVHIGNCETIKAMGRSDIFLTMEIIKKTGYAITIISFLFLTDSPVGLASSFVVCTLIALLVNSIPNRKLIGYSYKYQLLDLLPNLIISVLMCVPVYFIGKVAMPEILKMMAQIASGMLAYILINIMTKNESFYYLLHLITDNLRHRGINNG